MFGSTVSHLHNTGGRQEANGRFLLGATPCANLSCQGEGLCGGRRWGRGSERTVKEIDQQVNYELGLRGPGARSRELTFLDYSYTDFKEKKR